MLWSAAMAIMASRDTGTGGYQALPGAGSARGRMRPVTPWAAIFPQALTGSGMCHRHTLGCGSPGA